MHHRCQAVGPTASEPPPTRTAAQTEETSVPAWRKTRPSDSAGSGTRPDQPRHHSAKSFAGRPSTGPGSDPRSIATSGSELYHSLTMPLHVSCRRLTKQFVWVALWFRRARVARVFSDRERGVRGGSGRTSSHGGGVRLSEGTGGVCAMPAMHASVLSVPCSCSRDPAAVSSQHCTAPRACRAFRGSSHVEKLCGCAYDKSPYRLSEVPSRAD